MDQIFKHETQYHKTKTPGRNTGENLINIGLDNNLGDKMPKTQTTTIKSIF